MSFVVNKNRKKVIHSFYFIHDKAHEAHLVSARIPKYAAAEGTRLVCEASRMNNYDPDAHDPDNYDSEHKRPDTYDTKR